MHHFHGHPYCHDGLTSASLDLVASDAKMSPRNALPYAAPQPANGIGDFGDFINLNFSENVWVYGLEGVNQNLNWLLSNALVVSFFGMLAIVLAYRWLHMANAHLRHIGAMGPLEDQRYWMYNHSRLWPNVKKHLIYAPLRKVRHNRELGIPFTKNASVGMCTLPSRFHMIVLLLYCFSNMAYCLALDWDHPESSSVIAELRGRTGQLAALNIIPTVLFALRNNPLIHITRVSYDAYNLMHRWCARIMVIEAVLHTIAWAVNAHRAAGSAQVALSLATSTSFAWGMMATVVFSFIFVTAAAPIRHAFYETFLHLHRLLVLFGLIGVYVHLDAAGLPQTPYVELCFALWGAEWSWRFYRICYLNISRRNGITKITVEALPGDACRVTFDLRRPWTYTPGCHVHAYLPTISLWLSHPFSIAWAEKSKTSERELEREKISYNKPKDVLGVSRRPNAMPRKSVYKDSAVGTDYYRPKHTNAPGSHKKDVTTISLIVRMRNGMTRKLYERANALPSKVFTTWGAIEGPYGGHETFESYGTMILFAGGVGITHCVGYAHQLLTQYALGTCATQKILLIWSIPTTESLEWVREWMDQILRLEHRREVLRIQLFVTKPRHRGEVVSNTGSVQMFPGRCNPSTVMAKEMQQRIGAVGVTVCGPGAFADSVRQAVREVVTDGSVDFFEEAFTY